MSGNNGIYLAYSRDDKHKSLLDQLGGTALHTVVDSDSLYSLKSITIGAVDDLTVFMMVQMQFKDDYRFHRVKSTFDRPEDVHRIAKHLIGLHKSNHPHDAYEMDLWEKELDRNHNYFDDGLELAFGAV